MVQKERQKEKICNFTGRAIYQTYVTLHDAVHKGIMLKRLQTAIQKGSTCKTFYMFLNFFLFKVLYPHYHFTDLADGANVDGGILALKEIMYLEHTLRLWME